MAIYNPIPSQYPYSVDSTCLSDTSDPLYQAILLPIASLFLMTCSSLSDRGSLTCQTIACDEWMLDGGQRRLMCHEGRFDHVERFLLPAPVRFIIEVGIALCWGFGR